MFLQVFPETPLLRFLILLLQSGLASPGLLLPGNFLHCFPRLMELLMDPMSFVSFLPHFTVVFPFCPPTPLAELGLFGALWFRASYVTSLALSFLACEENAFPTGWIEMREWRGLRTEAGVLRGIKLGGQSRADHWGG